ncbi:protein spitz-like isoform X1 [Episyrphus balteatus]|uniref:protein spitz-like isoform X1 n=1 Tax=Episyrphus balteatus TaxID=286459 RepID=UPI0024862ED4|nr:protein spitz-like isoform X1 [Episyrphus balteatus]
MKMETMMIDNEVAAAAASAAHDATIECIWGKLRNTLRPRRDSITTASNEFFKFIARFSGRRRSPGINLEAIVLLVIISLFSTSEACSSRTVPKPRPPPPSPTPRPNITFHTYSCPPNYAAWYCLNSATCFSVKIGDEILYNCECAVGYMGPRCEYKEIDGSYLPTRPRAMLEKASIASGATLALIFVLILCLTWYMRCQQKQKARRLEQADCGMDVVDGMMKPEKRPFGPHHHYTLPMTSTFKR